MKRIYAEGKHTINSPNKDKKLEEITIKKISLANAGKHFSPKTEFKKGHKGFINNPGGFKKGQHIGNKNINWNGGSSFEPYDKEFNKQFKEFIKERDGCCMLCKVNLVDLKLLKRKSNIHHIDYNKLNTLPQNCCVLCNSCHMKTSFDRTIWTKHFQSLLSEIYGYKYSADGKIIITLNSSEEKNAKRI